MKILFATLVFLLPLFGAGQTAHKFLYVGKNTIAIELAPRFIVEEQVWDSVIYMPDSVYFELVPHYINKRGYTGEPIIKHNRQTYTEPNGMIWQQVIKQKKKRYKERGYPYPVLVNDSGVQVPTPVIRTDSVMQINPETMEEEMVIMHVKSLRVSYDLGNVRKEELKQSIINKFGSALNVSGIYLNMIGDTYYGYTAYYDKVKRLKKFVPSSSYWQEEEEAYIRNAETIESLCIIIDQLPSGSRITLGFEIVAQGKQRYFSNRFDALAVIRLVD